MAAINEVDLQDIRLSEIEIHLSARIDENGLTLEGQDLGPDVEEREYFLTVEPEHLDKILELLWADLTLETVKSEPVGGRDGLLLQALRIAYTLQRFKGISDLGAWLARHGIPSSTFTC